MKKIIILSLVCLGSGSLLAQSSTPSAAKTTTAPKIESTATPVDTKNLKTKEDVVVTPASTALNVKKIEPVTKTVYATKVDEKNVRVIPTLADAVSPLPVEIEAPATVPIKASPVKKEKD